MKLSRLFSADDDNYYEFDDEQITEELYPCSGGKSVGGKPCNGTCPGSKEEKDCNEGCSCSGNCNEPEPKDNNSREHCFWCGKRTIEKDGFTLKYDYCEECKK
jgi:hypothetical protein